MMLIAIKTNVGSMWKLLSNKADSYDAPIVAPVSRNVTDTCNVSFCLEMGSDYVISKSEGRLADFFAFL